MGNGLLRRMREGEMRPFAAQAGSKFGGFTAKPQLGTLAWNPHYLHILPRYTMAQTGPDGLHSRLFSGKAGGQALLRIRLTGAVLNFSRGKYALEEALPKALYCSPDPDHLGDINSSAYNHLADFVTYHTAKLAYPIQGLLI
jgi:hypothetical protein